MTDPIRDTAIEAAGKAQYGPRGLDLMRDWRRAKALADLAPLVDAVLAVAGPAYRAEALREVADEYEAYGDHAYLWQADQLRDRADAEENDHA